MPSPEYRNMPTEEVPELEKEAHTSDVPEYRSVSTVGPPPISVSQHEESLMEIMERFIEQDQELAQDVEQYQHLKPAVAETEIPSTELINKERLNEILEHARREDIPYKLLGYLWELNDCHPEDVEEVPLVREHALSDVIRPMWDKRLEHELKVDLLQDLEGDENIDKLFAPQPQSEIDNPQNLYQLVRKAWDQDRMEELLAMIEENDYALWGKTREEAAGQSEKEMDDYLRSLKEKRAQARQETT
jgi:hypothetical protein